jgi:hypothetical protein
LFDSWLTLSGSGMDLNHIDRVLTPDDIPIGGRWGRPPNSPPIRTPEGGSS